MHEAGSVFHACCICRGVWTVQSQMEVEVGELFLKLQEVLEIEQFVEGARAVEIVHFAVAGVEGLCHVHDLSAERGHTCAAANPHHLFLGVENGVEVSVRTAHEHLVAGLEREDIARCDTWHHVLETNLGFRFERRGRYAHGEHEAVALGGIVGHGVGAHGCLVVAALEAEQSELFPCGEIFRADGGLVDILVVVHGVGRNLYLGV